MFEEEEEVVVVVVVVVAEGGERGVQMDSGLMGPRNIRRKS